MTRIELLEKLVEEELKKKPSLPELQALCKDLKIPWSDCASDRMTLILSEMQSISAGRRNEKKERAANVER